jgi:hypothetical protein
MGAQAFRAGADTYLNMTSMTAIGLNLALGGPVVFGLLKLLAYGIQLEAAAAPSAETAPVAAPERLAA